MITECLDSVDSTVNSTEIAFSYHAINNSSLLQYANTQLPHQGILKYDELEQYCYLKIHDDFICKLFHFLDQDNINMPNYFNAKNRVGAHISVIYPNEVEISKLADNNKLTEVDQCFNFTTTDLIKVNTFEKAFIALVVSSPSLQQLRIKYGLKTKLNYRGLLVPFHITIATS